MQRQEITRGCFDPNAVSKGPEGNIRLACQFIDGKMLLMSIEMIEKCGLLVHLGVQGLFVMGTHMKAFKEIDSELLTSNAVRVLSTSFSAVLSQDPGNLWHQKCNDIQS